MYDTSADAVSPAAETSPDSPRQAVPPRLWQVIVIALIAIAFTAVYLGAYSALSNGIWLNHWSYVTSHRWLIPLGVMFFSLLVGLAQKYLRAPNAIDGGFVESMKGTGPKADYRIFPGALVTSFCSLLSGASVGPEGTISTLVQQLSVWFRERLKVSERSALGFDVAALASAFNGIIGNPLFTAVFATEYQVGGESGLVYLIWNLLAGAIGFSFYALLGLTSFASAIAFPPVSTLHPVYFLYAVLLGVVGAVMALFAGVATQVFGTLIARVFKERVMARALAAGVVISVVGVLIPELLFSGEESIHTIIADPAKYGVGLLLLMALLKILLLALSFKSGYLGGPVFPVLFASTMIALALHLVFTSVPLSILVLCIEGPAIALALSAPLTAILLVVVIGTAGPNEIALIVVATVVGLLIGTAARALMARRAAQAASGTGGQASAAASPLSPATSKPTGDGTSSN
jgi:H+/Cl- antiporter ClcA